MRRYGLDFDGTIADTNTMKAIWIKENLGLEIEPYNADRTNCVPIIGLDNYKRMSEVVFERESTLKTPEIPGALRAIEELSEKGLIYIITMRGTRKLDYSREWLEQNRVMRYISGMGKIENDNGTKKTKEELCKDLNLDVLVDDDERHLSDIKIPGLRRILIKNQSDRIYIPAKGVELATSWNEILRRI